MFEQIFESSPEKSEEKFKLAFEAAPNGMLMINSNRQIILVNKKIKDIFGYEENELLGNEIEILVPDSIKIQHPKLVEGFLERPEARSMGIGRELFGRHKNGRLIPVEVGLQPIATGKEVFVISSIIDITHRKKAEELLSRKTKEVEEFSYRTSHDLKSPLKSISAMADCAIENITDNSTEDALTNLHQVKELSSKLLTLIDAIMALTKADAINDEVNFFDIDEYIKTFKLKFSQLIKENNVIVETSFLHNYVPKIQSARLVQVLDNLLGNGIKYCDKNKTIRKIEISTRNDLKNFIINISDNGVGIPKDRQAEVFGMFKRFHDNSIEGTGLGLYLVFKQISNLKGNIKFESSESGTTFYIEIPISEL